jgi:hypothetical protein
MPSVAETSGAKSQLAAGLAEGINTLSNNQTITFTKYVRYVLPLDGYVFWVRSDLAGFQTNAAPVTVAVQGSFHYASDTQQREDETFAINRVVFTALSEIQDFNLIEPCVMYIGEFEGVRFAFTQRKSFYRQADLYHYVGNAVYPAMASQVIDCVEQLTDRSVVVSNSLPVWLSLNQIMPMFPSFLVPDNLPPVYAAVHIEPDATRALQSVPSFDSTLTHYQLVSDRVKITMYGMRNFNALDFQDYIYNYMLNDDNLFGLMNMPVIRDEKRTQAELSVIAMKKSIEFEVSYYQTRVNDVARQLILTCVPNFYIGTASVS